MLTMAMAVTGSYQEALQISTGLLPPSPVLLHSCILLFVFKILKYEMRYRKSKYCVKKVKRFKQFNASSKTKQADVPARISSDSFS